MTPEVPGRSLMKLHHFILLVVIAAVLVVSGCRQTTARNRIDESNLPRIILWAWEHPEDLEFLDPNHFGVAFLAQTLTLKNGDVVYSPRLQPLKLPPQVKLIAVTRIESEKITHQPIVVTDDMRRKLVERIKKTLDQDKVKAIQVDFDVAISERHFYRQLLEDLRHELPDNVPLSITALASFCVGDRWLSDLPVDEAVPMVFRMGMDSDRIKNMLSTGGDFNERLCRRSYGVALDEPVSTLFERQRRVYVFNERSWTPADIAVLEKRFGS
jgi:hypothetical protein